MNDIKKIITNTKDKMIKKYELNNTQQLILDNAIDRYDYEQNEGTIFRSQFTIFSLFTSRYYEDKNGAIEAELLTAPHINTIFALCEYIIETISLYDIGGLKSYADDTAKDILKYSIIYNKEV